MSKVARGVGCFNVLARATSSNTTTLTSQPMARQKSSLGPLPTTLASRTLILDNGAHTIKAGFATQGSQASTENDCHLIPNCVARSHRDKRTYVGVELTDCADFGELAFRRPVEKGFIVGWEAEKAIWERTLYDKTAPLQVRHSEQ